MQGLEKHQQDSKTFLAFSVGDYHQHLYSHLSFLELIFHPQTLPQQQFSANLREMLAQDQQDSVVAPKQELQEHLMKEVQSL